MAIDPKSLGLGLGTNEVVELVAKQIDAVAASSVQVIEGPSAFSVTGATPSSTVANTATTTEIVNYLAALTAALQASGVI